MRWLKGYTYLLFIVLLACSTDSESEGNNTEPIEIEIKQLKTAFGTGGDVDFRAYFHYENNVLNKSSLIHGWIYDSYEINDQGKISSITRYDNGGGPPNQDVDFYDEGNFDGEQSVEEYEWLSGTSFLKSGKTYNVDEHGRLISLNCGGQYCETINIYYSDENIESVVYNEGESYQNIYTFEFDEGINPMFAMFKKYGFVEYINLGMYDYFFDFYYINNPTKIYKNGELEFTATYHYTDSRYPIQATYHRLETGERGEIVFTYQD